MAERTTRIHNKIHWVPTEPADPQPSPQTTLKGHLGLVARVESAGIQPPPQWLEIKAGLDNFRAALSDRPLTADLSAEVIANGANITTLLALASTETLENRIGVAEIVHANVHAALVDAYAVVAERNYKTLASRFDAAAKRFTKLSHSVDLEARADDVIADRRQLAMWEEGPANAAELTSLVDPLVAAALLARRIEQPCRLGTDPATLEIPLCLDFEGAHTREVWLSWQEQVEVRPSQSGEAMLLTLTDLTEPALEKVAHRTGRWSGVLAAGASISAHPRPESLELFGRPQNRQIAVADANGRRIRPRVIDPEDHQTRPSRFARLVGALSSRRTPDEPADVLASVLDNSSDQEQPHDRIEHSGRGDDVGVVIRGLARATTLSVDQLLALSATGLLENTVFGIDGKIRPAFRRTMSWAEARAKLAERRSDGSPRKRCSACGECFTDDWKCYCSRLRGPGKMPYGGWPTVSASMVRRTRTTPSTPPSARP